MPRKKKNKAVSWLSEEIVPDHKVANTFRYYKKFQFKKIIAEIGDFVLISNADSAEPDTEAGCDAARILTLFEDQSNNQDPFRAKVQWYSRPEGLPRNFSSAEPIEFLAREVLEDHRPFDTNVSIETFFKACSITLTFTKDTGIAVNKPFNYICRYRLVAVTKRKVQIEPVLEEERKAILLLHTPVNTSKPNTPKTPNSLVKRMSRVSLSEQKNWSVSKNDGTKLLLKRAILADTIEKNSPKKNSTSKSTPKQALKSPNNNRKLTTSNIEALLSMEMELQENSDDELPTLIIRQTPDIPNRKTTLSRTEEGTEKNVSHSLRSSRYSESQSEQELSPVKRTPKKVSHIKKTIKKASHRMSNESSDEELPTLIIKQHTPTTPKRKVPVSKISEITTRKVLLNDNKESSHISRSRRSSRNSELELSPVKRTPKKASCEKETDKATLIDNKEISFRTTRSGKVSKSPSYSEQELSPVKKTIKKALHRMSTESSDEELPTLIIKQYTPTTPKRKVPVSKISEGTTRKVLLNDNKDSSHISRSRRSSRNSELELSPVKRTPKKASCEKETDKATLIDNEEISFRTTRSGRVSKIPSYLEQELSPVKRTPRKTKTGDVNGELKITPKKSKCSLTSDSDNESKSNPLSKTPRTPKAPRTPRTPKVPRTPRTPRTSPEKTPKRNITKRILTSQLTPSLQARAQPIDNIDCFTKENKSLPGREQQIEEILSYVRSNLLEGTSGCMFISGMPGTGKTATVNSALSILKDEVDLPDFQLLEVNGMKITEPRQVYVQIYKQLTGKTVAREQACTLLQKRFTISGPRRAPTVLLLDEFDALSTRRQDVFYNIVEWTRRDSARFIVLAVANTMDLAERMLAGRVASRAGITRLSFPSYTHAQLQNIVSARLCGATVTPDALQLMARKVASVSGDARRALALCDRVLELAGPGGAGLKEVQQALGQASSGATVRAIRCCSQGEKLMLRAVAAEAQRTGSDETTLSRALATAAAIVALDGRPYRCATHVRAPSASEALAMCSRLSAQRLLLLEPKPGDPRLLLNVSADDVHYATKQIAM